MARYTGPKHRLARREGENIIGKTSASLLRRLSIPPGVIHGRRRVRKMSSYGEQLREKQKLKRIYGILERQFRKYIKEAQRKKGNTEEALIQLLETRLDNIVYRLGYGKTRPQARQLVTHRHIMVNGKKANIPSYRVKAGDVISVVPKLLTDEVKEMIHEVLPPSYLARHNFDGKLERLPQKEEVVNPVNYQIVIEFYSR